MALSVVAVSIAALGSFTSSVPAVAVAEEPIVARGTLPAPYRLDDVTVELVPDLSLAGSGANLQTRPVSPDDLVLDQDNVLTVRLDPNDVGATYRDRRGYTTIKILAADGETIWTTMLTAQAVEAADSEPRWIEPGAAAELVDGPATGKFEGRRFVVSGRDIDSAPVPEFASPEDPGSTPVSGPLPPALRADDPPTGDPTWDPADDDSGDWDGGTSMPSRGSCPGGGEGPHQVDKVDERLVWATIGTTYPIGNSTGWMEVSANNKNGASYGVGVQYVGQSIKASGTTWASGGWTKKWNAGGDSRSYRKQIVEYKMRFHGYLNPACDHYHWIAIEETGGTATNKYGVSRPDWNTYCAPESPGPFGRNESGGKTYDYASALKMKSIIGIDLGIKREYTEAQSVWYDIKGKNKYLCGNNAYPRTAGKLIERYKSGT